MPPSCLNVTILLTITASELAASVDLHQEPDDCQALRPWKMPAGR
ncbi:hypothetical protein BURCE16_36165 [Burkholderia cepacia]|nr:hypothetical protein BURCE16_36165 [Burkholderia cepacia]